MTEAALSPAFSEALEGGEWDRVEELWLEALEKDPMPTAVLMETRRRLWEEGKKNLARTLLELMADSAEENGDGANALQALRELVRLTDKPDIQLRERLLAAFKLARAGQASLPPVLKNYPMLENRKPLQVLENMEIWLNHDIGTIVEVQGQGVGRVSELNLALGNLKVEVGAKRPVSIPFGAVTRFVKRLPEGHFLRLKVEDPQGLAVRVADDPGACLVHILESFGEPTNVATIKDALAGILGSSSWTSWWTKARKHPRILSAGTGSRLRYSVTESAEDAVLSLLSELETKDPRVRIKAAKDLGARGGDAAKKAAEVLAKDLDALTARDPGVAWETADLLSALTPGSETAERCMAHLATEANPLKLLSGIKERNQRQQALERIQAARADEWAEIWAEWMLHEKTTSILSSISQILDTSGNDSLLDSSLETIFRNHKEYPAQFIWAAEEMTNDAAPEALQRRLRPSLLEKIPDALTGKEFADLRNRAKGLLEGGKAAIRVLLEYANPQQAERFSQRAARIDAVDPGQLRLVEQAAVQAAGSNHAEELGESTLFVATQEAIDRKRAELKTLVELEIPQTLKGIKAAADEGDLRENFEYHMLRDRQELQSARAAKIQEDLGQVRVLEPGAAQTEKVNIGTIVHLEALSGDTIEPLTILGSWDADLNRRIFANGTELAKKLLGSSVGDTVTVEGIEAKITRIGAWPENA